MDSAVGIGYPFLLLCKKGTNSTKINFIVLKSCTVPYFCYFRVENSWYVRVTKLKIIVILGVTFCYENTLQSHGKIPFLFVGYCRALQSDWYFDTLLCYFCNKLIILWTYLSFVLLWVLLPSPHMSVQEYTEENNVRTTSTAMCIRVFLLPF